MKELKIKNKGLTINIILFIGLLFLFNNTTAQGVLPIQRYIVQKGGLDAINAVSTFGYSMRKLSTTYTWP